MTRCPCCGRDLPAGGPLVVSREHHTLARSGQLLRVPARVTDLAALLRQSPRTAREISSKLLGRETKDGVPSLVFVYLSQLRRHLTPLGAHIERRGGRYHLIETSD